MKEQEGKEVKMELDSTQKSEVAQEKDTKLLEEEKAKKKTVTKTSLKRQLDMHIKHVKPKRFDIIGYSILFAEKLKEGEATYGMATSYPGVLNNLMLGYHTNVLSNVEIGILQLIAAEASMRIKNLEKATESTAETEEKINKAIEEVKKHAKGVKNEEDGKVDDTVED